MKRAILLFFFSTAAFAQTSLTNAPLEQDSVNAPYNVYIQDERMGSGVQTQNTKGYEKAWYWGDGLYSVPRYLPGFATAHMGWSRSISVPCKQEGSIIVCSGYTILSQQAQDRGEWILFHPVVEALTPVAPPQIIEKTVIVKEPCSGQLPDLNKKIRQ